MNKKSYFSFCVAFLILLAAVFLYQKSFTKLNEYTYWVNHTQNVILTFEALSGDIKSAQIIPSNPDKEQKNAIFKLYRNDIQKIPEAIRNLRLLVIDNNQQRQRLDTIDGIYNSHLKWMLTKSIRDPLTSNAERMQYVLVIEQLIERGISTEKKLLAERKTNLQRSAYKTNALIILFISTSLLLIILISISNFYHISKRQNLEQFLQSVLNTSQNGIITYQAIRKKKQIVDFRIVFVNDSMGKQFKMKPEELPGKSILKINSAIFENGHFQKYIHVTETGERDEFEISFQGEHSIHWHHVILAKLNDGFTATFHDITVLKNYQQELQEKVQLLEHNNSELEQFAYVASHDLQEPLRKIKTFASLINERQESSDPGFLELYLNKIIHSADRMGHLISDLLNLSSISTEQNSFIKTDLNQVLTHVIDDFELIIQEKKAVINSMDLPEIEAIPLQMNQLFYNLINNALKFSKPGRDVTININCEKNINEQMPQPDLTNHITFYKITVSDNGIGFNNSYADKIFVIFQRLNNRQAFTGSGIGLALCRKIVLNHHGSIYAEAKEDEGASFHVTLPEIQFS